MAISADSKIETLASYVTRAKDGSIDVQSTHVRFTEDLRALVSSERTDNEVIAQAVTKAFKSHPGTKTLGMGQLIHYTMENLEVEPANFNTIQEKVRTYVRANTKQFKVAKGKGGGVSWLDEESGGSTSSAPSSGSMRPRQNA